MPELEAPSPAERAAPSADPTRQLIRTAAREISVSNPGRVLWPATGFTKAAMIDYYLAVAPAMLPHLAGRALSLRRFPEGVDGPGWYQAQCRGRPPWMRVAEVAGVRGEVLRYCVIEEAAGLAWAANLGTVEFHPLLWRTAAPAEPSALVLDLDPGPPASLPDACRLALVVREVFATLGPDTVVKTSGSIGLHVFVPLAPGHSFGQTKAFARRLAAGLARTRPWAVVDTNVRSARAGRVYLDWIQNDRNRSTVAPYSLRATPVPLVSTPVSWSEVEHVAATGRFERLLFGPREVLARIDRLGDLFADAEAARWRLPTEEALDAAVARAAA